MGRGHGGAIAIATIFVALIGSLGSFGTFAFGDGFFSKRDAQGGCDALGSPKILDDDNFSAANGWDGWQTMGGPHVLADPNSPSEKTLVAEFERSRGEASLHRKRAKDLSRYGCMTADVRAVAADGVANATAKLYVRLDSNTDSWNWRDDGPAAVGSTGQLLKLDLTKIHRRDKTMELGVVFASIDNSTETLTIHLDRISLYR